LFFFNFVELRGVGVVWVLNFEKNSDYGFDILVAEMESFRMAKIKHLGENPHRTIKKPI
jgi:hypothetical protein